MIHYNFHFEDNQLKDGYDEGYDEGNMVNIDVTGYQTNIDKVIADFVVFLRHMTYTEEQINKHIIGVNLL